MSRFFSIIALGLLLCAGRDAHDPRASEPTHPDPISSSGDPFDPGPWDHEKT